MRKRIEITNWCQRLSDKCDSILHNISWSACIGVSTGSDVPLEIRTNPAQCSQKVGFRYVISWKLWMKPGPILHWSSGLARRKYAIISSLLINPSLQERVA